MFAAWYTYAADGNPTWFTMSCKLVGNQCSDNLYTVTGKPLSAGLTNIGANASVAGSGSITFNSTSNLTFAYTVQGRTKTISDVLKFNFVPADKIPVCTQSTAARGSLTNYTDMWWGGADAGGWGLSLAHQGDIIFVAFYTYSDDRKPAWTVGLANKVVGTAATYSGDFSTPRTGTPYYDINGTDATTFPAPKTGSFTLTFPTGDAATLEYELAVGGSASVNKGRVALNRFAVASGATTSCGVSVVMPPTGAQLPIATLADVEACPAAPDYQFNKNWYTTCLVGKRLVGKDKDTQQACELRLNPNRVIEYAREGVVVVSIQPLPEVLSDSGIANYINFLDPNNNGRVFFASAGVRTTSTNPKDGFGFSILVNVDKALPEGLVNNLRLASISRKLGNDLVCSLDVL